MSIIATARNGAMLCAIVVVLPCVASPVATGRVVDPSQRPVAHATIVVSDGVVSVSGHTKPNGYFSVPIDTRNRTVTCNVSAAAYSSLRLNLRRRGDEFHAGSITLKLLVQLDVGVPVRSASGNEIQLPVTIRSSEPDNLIASGFRLIAFVPGRNCEGPTPAITFVISAAGEIVRIAQHTVAAEVTITAPSGSALPAFQGTLEFSSCSGGILTLTGSYPTAIAKGVSELNLVVPSKLVVKNATQTLVLSLLTPSPPGGSRVAVELLVSNGGSIPAERTFNASMALN